MAEVFPKLIDVIIDSDSQVGLVILAVGGAGSDSLSTNDRSQRKIREELGDGIFALRSL